jgi:hypothetical protein
MGLPARVRRPISSSQSNFQKDQENKMLFDRDHSQMMQEMNILEQAAARTGFSVSDIKALVDCELETGYVLDYISAVVSNRMN